MWVISDLPSAPSESGVAAVHDSLMNDMPLTFSPDASDSYGIHSQPVWDQARLEYIDGQSSTDICRRYGLSRSTFHARAAREGWRRRDQPARTVTPYIAVTGDIDEASFFDLSEMAALCLRQAILSGRPTEATGWLGLVRELRHESEYHDPGPEWFQHDADLDSLDKLDSPDASPDQPENPP